jgi:hypothetical protein
MDWRFQILRVMTGILGIISRIGLNLQRFAHTQTDQLVLFLYGPEFLERELADRKEATSNQGD